MAYNSYVACDRCGTDFPFACNQTVSMSKAVKIMKRVGWTVKTYKEGLGRTDWFCPDCAKHKDLFEDEEGETE